MLQFLLIIQTYTCKGMQLGEWCAAVGAVSAALCGLASAKAEDCCCYSTVVPFSGQEYKYAKWGRLVSVVSAAVTPF